MLAPHRLDQRRAQWLELEDSCAQLEKRHGRRVGPVTLSRFGFLYRSVCADLALAESYQLPQETVVYLNQLVGRAHHQLYRARRFQLRRWLDVALRETPRIVFRDHCVKLAFVLFWGLFLLAAALGYSSAEFCERLAGKEFVQGMEEMHAANQFGRAGSTNLQMAGFYVFHNAGIGLRCFAFGLLFGVGGLLETATNALVLGSVFGHMANTPASKNFFEFVTAHGPFELSAIVLSAAVGMRLGFSLIATGGLSRAEALRRSGREAMPVVVCSVVMFGFAALIEGFVSPSAAPYAVKAMIGAFSAALILFYFVGLGAVADDVSPEDQQTLDGFGSGERRV